MMDKYERAAITRQLVSLRSMINDLLYVLARDRVSQGMVLNLEEEKMVEAKRYVDAIRSYRVRYPDCELLEAKMVVDVYRDNLIPGGEVRKT